MRTQWVLCGLKGVSVSNQRVSAAFRRFSEGIWGTSRGARRSQKRFMGSLERFRSTSYYQTAQAIPVNPLNKSYDS